MSHVKLGQFWHPLLVPSLYTPLKRNIYIFGDSINAIRYNYFPVGWRRLPIKVRGLLLCGNAGSSASSWGYSNAQGSPAVNNLVSPLGAAYLDATAASVMTEITGLPIFFREMRWGVDSATYLDNHVNSTRYAVGTGGGYDGFDGIPGRNSFLFHDGTITYTTAWFLNHARTLGKFNVVARRSSDQNSTTWTKGATDNKIVTVGPISCATDTSAANTAEPNCQFKQNVGGFSAGSADMIGHVGCFYETAETDGVNLFFMGNSSWTTGDWLSSTGCSDARLREIFALKYPTDVLFMLGENVNNGSRAGSAELLASGSSTEYLDNMDALRSKIITAAQGAASDLSQSYVEPRFCAANYHRTGSKTLAFRQTLQAALIDFAHSYSNQAFLDFYEATGGEDWPYTLNNNNDSGNFIHPTSSGSRAMGAMTSIAISREIEAYLHPNNRRSLRMRHALP